MKDFIFEQRRRTIPDGKMSLDFDCPVWHYEETTAIIEEDGKPNNGGCERQ